MVNTLNAILDGATLSEPINLTTGLVLQLYHLIFNEKPTELKVKSWGAFYTVLAVLGRGRHLQDSADAKRLTLALTRASRPFGLYKLFQEELKRRASDPELPSDIVEARNALFMRWDAKDFDFAFAGAPPPPPPAPPAPAVWSPPPSFFGLDLRTQAFAAAAANQAFISFHHRAEHNLPSTVWHEG